MHSFYITMLNNTRENWVKIQCVCHVLSVVSTARSCDFRTAFSEKYGVLIVNYVLHTEPEINADKNHWAGTSLNFDSPKNWLILKFNNDLWTFASYSWKIFVLKIFLFNSWQSLWYVKRSIENENPAIFISDVWGHRMLCNLYDNICTYKLCDMA